MRGWCSSTPLGKTVIGQECEFEAQCRISSMGAAGKVRQDRIVPAFGICWRVRFPVRAPSLLAVEVGRCTSTKFINVSRQSSSEENVSWS